MKRALAQSLILALSVVGLIGLALSSLLPEYWARVLFSAFLFAYLASAWNLMAGLVGLVSLGHMAFVGIGAYTSTLLMRHFSISPWVGMFAGAVLAGCLAFAIGYVSFRMRLPHASLSLLTLVVGQAALLLAQNLTLTQGPRGLIIPLDPRWEAMQFSSASGYLAVIIAMTAMLVTFSIVLRRSGFGYRLRSIRENERLAESLGVPTTQFKLLVTVVSGSLTALGGTLMAQYTLFISPDSVFGVFASLEITVYALVGGVTSPIGPIVGALALYPISEALRSMLSNQGAALHRILFGIALVLVVLRAPQGIVGQARSITRSWVSGFIARASSSRRVDESRRVVTEVPQPTRGVTALRVSRRETDEEPGGGRTQGGAPLLRLEGVTQRFGGIVALENVSLDVSSGAILGIIGPNGAGKSTLFEVIAGGQRPTSGRISFRGHDLTGVEPHRRCLAGIGRTFQLIEAFQEMSVFENVLVGALSHHTSSAVAREWAIELLHGLGLADHSHHRASDLNLAQLRRLDIARALSTRPELLLLDEMMAGLNDREILESVALIQRIRESGVTVLVVEHHVGAISQVSDEVLVLDFGKVICQGLPGDVLKDERVVSSYLGRRAVASA